MVIRVTVVMCIVIYHIANSPQTETIFSLLIEKNTLAEQFFFTELHDKIKYVILLSFFVLHALFHFKRRLVKKKSTEKEQFKYIFHQ